MLEHLRHKISVFFFLLSGLVGHLAMFSKKTDEKKTTETSRSKADLHP